MVQGPNPTEVKRSSENQDVNLHTDSLTEGFDSPEASQ